jgi:hypothetical protein
VSGKAKLNGVERHAKNISLNKLKFELLHCNERIPKFLAFTFWINNPFLSLSIFLAGQNLISS